MEFVCPLPKTWHAIHQRLHSAWEHGGRKGVPPPVPLILAGWAGSNDVEKQERWNSTIEWAEERGLENLVTPIDPDEAYMVRQLDSRSVGPMGGPMYLRWDMEPKRRPTDEELQSALASLVGRWEDIAGAELSRVTRPLRFTGSKRRRLVVLADSSYDPPWGSWSCLAPGEKRRSFTQLRSAVNTAIHPHMVDHIDFVSEDDSVPMED